MQEEHCQASVVSRMIPPWDLVYSWNFWLPNPLYVNINGFRVLPPFYKILSPKIFVE
jgi:hypothetical protein